MDSFLRAVAVIVEVLILAGIIFVIFNGIRLVAFDVGANPKYNKMLILALSAVGAIVVAFFVAHLTTFYPTV